MNDIEKRARELLESEYRREDTAGARLMAGCLRDGETHGFEVELRAIVAAMTIREGELLARGAVNLLREKGSGVVLAQELDVVPATALGADEAGAVGVGGQGDHPVGAELAEVASEHEVGLLLASDGHLTSPLVQQARQFVARAMEENRDPEFAKAVLAGRYDNGNSVKAVSVALALIPQWQSIEFNEDGQPTNVPEETPILVPPTKRLGMTVAKWSRRDGWETETTSEWVGMYRPTHWMPLPAEPEVTQ
ncbi:MAG: DUF551 domain-containing protein [Stenotrophomonas sp.]|uniref:DUF551 domain-containing protein n=1 Tax=Stenotrophomonas sp. TaxID=69392 RepID=UPI003D6CEBF9